MQVGGAGGVLKPIFQDLVHELAGGVWATVLGVYYLKLPKSENGPFCLSTAFKLERR